MVANMVADMAANMEVHMMADMDMHIVADTEGDKVADMVADKKNSAICILFFGAEISVCAIFSLFFMSVLFIK